MKESLINITLLNRNENKRLSITLPKTYVENAKKDFGIFFGKVM